MKGYEITRELRERRTGNDQFIKWWRKENDFLDYDLIDRFTTNFRDSEEIYGFDLLDTEEMWNEVKKICGNRVTRITRDGSDYLSWQPPRPGKQRQECLFTPQSLINIFDAETKGNPVDS
ncbi:hypothetical protein [Geobacter sp. DSM 9736]|uniref:hypothetical protein n=1 Tax=Geobacter sp. DSM 9736 TaxID=1277350 RepID=UPI000B504CAB|nr:hypothetical protein [Geobacter sp. DSM 9736]SNB45304.1 hypothetical protein SAMN06269301_0711 [Geobacter sp. DSM 9736]